MSELRGRLLLDGRWIAGTLHFEGGTIAGIDMQPDAEDAGELPYVAPGLIDLHVHGFGGFDPIDELGNMASALARAGTTAFQPTMFPAAPALLGELCVRASKQARELSGGCARALGLHLEGPFVNPKSAGALPIEDLAVPSVDGLRAILGPAGGEGRGVSTVTLAPELPGSADLIRELVRCDVRVSLGHSLASFDEARVASRAGALGATHLFNAMAPLHHRELGLAGFALSDAALHAEIIGDLVHVGARAFELALKLRGPAGLCLVSDALRGAGTGCDVFHWHGREHHVRDGAAYYPGHEPKLAGSALSQLEMVQRLVRRGVVSLADALTMASESPAKALGCWGERGCLSLGARADAIVLEPQTLELAGVYVSGERVRGDGGTQPLALQDRGPLAT